MDRLPPLKSLLAFRYAAESLSFKAAANRLFVSQAAVSQQIKILEQHLGFPLFKRQIKEVSLTPQGKQLLPYVQQGFSLLEKGLAALQSDPQPDRLSMSVLPSFAARWLVSRLGHFQDQHPDLMINLSPSMALASFEGTELDLAIRFGQGNYPELESRLLLEEWLIPVCHPSLINAEQPILPQLRTLPMLADEAPDAEQSWQSFVQYLGLKNASHQTRLTIADSTMLVEAVLSGQGLALIRYSLCYELLQRSALLCPVPFSIRSDYHYYLVAPKGHFKRPKVMKFERWIVDEVAAITQHWQGFATELSRQRSDPQT